MQAYEWALEAMKYMSRVKPEEAQNPDHSVKQLRQYLMAHPPLVTEHFTEMMSLAKKLGNDKLLEQCKVMSMLYLYLPKFHKVTIFYIILHSMTSIFEL